jgi:hypothetical protein
MGDLPYDLNTIKLTWIKPDDYTILHSKMFDSLDEALKNVPEDIKKEDFMVMQLIKTDGTAYDWKLLPYGQHDKFIRGMSFVDNKFLYYGTMALVVIGLIYIVKLIATKYNKNGSN